MYWFFVAAALWILTKIFGWDKAVNIMMVIPLIISVVLIVGFFIFFVLPSSTWRNL